MTEATNISIKSPSPSGPRSEERHVSVSVPGRLHFGFLDLHGGLGRRFGSIGMALEEICTCLSVSFSQTLKATGPCALRAEKLAKLFLERLDLPTGAPRQVAIEISRAIPEHMGLGSGTQMAMAIGSALSALYELDLTPMEIAKIGGRGARSGIGIGAFDCGGVILDGGNPVARGRPEGGDTPPPVISRFDFPQGWRVLLIFDNALAGLHGDKETGAFKELPPYPEELAGHLCRLMVMKALPALAEKNFLAFAQAITELQKVVGDHFASAQGGRYASTAVAQALSELESLGVVGFGQSSWGPTGFALFEDQAKAQKSLDIMKEKHDSDEGLGFVLCRGRNQSSLIEIHDMARFKHDMKTHA